MDTTDIQNSAPPQGFSAAEGALIADFYQGVGTNQFFQQFAEALAAVLDLRSGSLAISNLASREMRGGWSFNIDPHYLGVYVANNLALEDRLLHKVLQAPQGQFYSILADLPDAEDYLQNSKLYEIWGRPQDIHDVAMALLLYEGEWIGFVAFHRSRAQGPFQSQELACLNQLLPHLQRGLQLHRQLVEMVDHRQVVQRWLSLLQLPTLLFDEKFEVVLMNPAAESYLQTCDELAVVDARLDFGDAELNARAGFQVMTAIKHALGQFTLEPEVMRIESRPEAPFSLVFLPLRDNGSHLVTAASALVLIYDAAAMPALDLTPLQTLFGFTAAELALCSALCQGQSLSEYAEQQNKSRETLRTQLRRVFSKVRVNSQTELVTSLMTHPALLALPTQE